MLMSRVRTAIAMALVAGIAVTGLGLSMSGGASEPRNHAGQQVESSKVDVPVAQPATEVKAVSPKTADETEVDNEPKRVSFRASPACRPRLCWVVARRSGPTWPPKTRSLAHLYCSQGSICADSHLEQWAPGGSRCAQLFRRADH